MKSRRNRFIKTLFAGSATAAVALLLTYVLSYAGLWRKLENATWAWRVRAGAHRTGAGHSIAVVLIDQTSLDWGRRENLWPWPWPREVYTAIINFCRRGGARVIVLDLLFSEPSWAGEEDDKRLAEAVAGGGDFLSGAPVVVGLFLGRSTEQAEKWPPEVPRPPWRIEGLERVEPHARVAFTAPRAAFPVTPVAKAACVLGNVRAVPGEEGVIRKVSLFQEFDHCVVPSLGIAAYFAEKAEKADISLAFREKKFLIDSHSVPVSDDLLAIPRYREWPGAYKTYRAASIIQSELLIQEGREPSVDPSEFKGKYVFIGTSAPGLGDLRSTPGADLLPGVVIHANVLDNLLSGDFIAPVPQWISTLFTLVWTLSACVLVAAISKLRNMAGAVLLTLAAPFACGFFAYYLGFRLPVALPAGSVFLGVLASSFLKYATEGRRHRFIRNAFAHYLSPQVIEKILADPDRLRLGGERRVLTIFFSDLEKFSTISERLEPERLTALLNEYLSDMTDIILDEGGTLDKYEGDAVVAFWNAPLSQEDHAYRACRAALLCQRKLKQRKEDFLERYGARLRMRIGLHTGPVVVGNLGSSRRFDYTILGDAANVASRLEGANKAFGTEVMVSEDTVGRTGGALITRELGLVQVVGRSTPLRVYELRGFAGEEDPLDLDRFDEGLRLLRGGRPEEALRCFEALGGDRVSLLYAERCRALLSGESWDGVWRLTEK